MVLGIGIDVVETIAVERAIQRDNQCAAAWLSENELKQLGSRATDVRTLAVHVAAKEAVAKALGTGFTGEVAWQDIEVNIAGAKTITVRLCAGAKAAASRRGIEHVMVSVSGNGLLAIASALAFDHLPSNCQTMPR